MKPGLFKLILIFVSCYILAPLVLHAADPLPGSGFDSRDKTRKDSPLKNVEYCWGNAISGVNFDLILHNEQKTKDVLIEGGASIGCAILGAEVTGQLKMADAHVREYFSCELVCQSSQDIRVNKFSRKDELGSGRVLWDRARFKDKYGDCLLWSLKRGGKLRLTIIASHEASFDSTDINLSAKIKLLFAKIKVGEVNINSFDSSDKFTYSVYFSQEGGSEEAKQKLIKRIRINSIGDVESCQSVVSAAIKYYSGSGPEDFPEQVKKFPGVWDEEYISYGDRGRIAFLWDPLK